MFSELGYAAATFQAIAVRADLTRPAINHYFASKRALYQEVVEQTNAWLVESGIRRSEQETTLPGRMRAFIEAAVQAQGQNRTAAAFLVTAVLESQRHPDLSQSDNGSMKITRAFLTSAVKDAIDSGELRADLDLDTTVEMLVAVLWGLGFYAGFVGSQERLVAITDQFLQLLSREVWSRAD